MPERQTLNPQRNGHEIFNANELTSDDFRRISEAAGLSLGTHQNGNYPSPRLWRCGEIEIVCRENTVGAIRAGTVFIPEGKDEFTWYNPGVEISDTGVIFTNFDIISLGDSIRITPKSVELFIKERE